MTGDGPDTEQRQQGGARAVDRPVDQTGPLVRDVDLALAGTRDAANRLLHDALQLDRAVYGVIAEQETPALDRPLRLLSDAANRSALWLGIAAALALFGGDSGRRAARDGVAAIGIVSVVANLGLKAIHRRQRPDRTTRLIGVDRVVRMPGSASFPSGHSASAFAFTSAVASQMPVLALPLGALAAAVAYSRVHTGVHYPIDVLAGTLLGIAVGQTVGREVAQLLEHRMPGRHHAVGSGSEGTRTAPAL